MNNWQRGVEQPFWFTIQPVLPATWETIHPDHHEGSLRNVLELELGVSDICAALSRDHNA